MIHTFDDGHPKTCGRFKLIQYTINEKGCWVCVSHRKKTNGYIKVSRNGKRNTYLHRYSYTLAKGHIPKGMVVLHSCDEPSCFNPNHLECDTQAANLKDAVLKGRKGRKLTIETAKGIFADARPQVVIAKEYGVSQVLVSLIKSKKIWKHILEGVTG